jgi:glycosyltransferase involved in cell wall biosynthesis
VKVALTGPVDLELLQPALREPVTSRGYSFPLTSYLALALAEQGHEVSVVALDPEARTPYHLSGESLDVTAVPMRPRARDRALDAFRSERHLLAEAIRDARPDVVHAHWTYEFALAARRSGIPALVTVHDWAPAVLAHHRDAYRVVRLGMQVRSLAVAERLTAVSPYIQRKVTSRFRRACTLVPNGLPGHYYDVAPRAQRLSGPVTYGCLVSGDDRRKNLPVLLEAFGLLQAQVAVGVRLVVAGVGCGPGERLHRWALARGLDDGVEFRGRLDPSAVPKYLAGLHAFVHPAREESFGMVLIEAMAAGTPVVGGARSGAVPWVLDEGRAGLLADVSSPAALAEAMRAMLDPETRLAWSARGRERAEEFRIASVAEQYVAEYQRLLG